MSKVKLSACDWEEIAVTLETKIMSIKNGDYGDGEKEDDNDRWVAQLRSIIQASRNVQWL